MCEKTEQNCEGQGHSPAPWAARGADGKFRADETAWRADMDSGYDETIQVPVFDASGKTVCIVVMEGSEGDAELEANADLIAAGPSMRALLMRLIKWDTDFPVNSYNGYAGLKELDKIIADAKAVTGEGGEI